MLALAGMIGADARVPSMVLQRAPLGRRGSYLATGLNVLQCLGWAIFELIVIATAAAALSERAFGFEATWAWKLLFGVLATVLALLGPVGFVRQFVRKLGIWVVLASVLYLGWWILDHGDVSTLWGEPGQGGSFWLAVDLVIALCVSWIPLVADYTRFSTTRRAAFWGVGLGYLLPTLFQFGFGSILVLSHPDDRRADGGADHGRGRRHRQLPRAARADGGRDRRGVRERLLGRGVVAERADGGAAARGSSSAPPRSRPPSRSRSTSPTTSSSSCSWAPSSCRCSACCSPTGC